MRSEEGEEYKKATSRVNSCKPGHYYIALMCFIMSHELRYERGIREKNGEVDEMEKKGLLHAGQ